MKSSSLAGLSMLHRGELSTYLKGLWLLIRGDAMGARYLDLTDRGMVRSFLAPIICLPALCVSWLWWGYSYRQITGSDTNTGAIFYVRLALVEAICWLVPFILMGLLLYAFKAKGKFPAIVTTANWLAVPFSYIYALLILIAFFIPVLQATVAVLFMGLLLALVVSYSRIIRFFIRDQGLLVFAVVMTLLIPQIMLSEALQRFLGIYPL
jgi:hypothetical protein